MSRLYKKIGLTSSDANRNLKCGCDAYEIQVRLQQFSYRNRSRFQFYLKSPQ